MNRQIILVAACLLAGATFAQSATEGRNVAIAGDRPQVVDEGLFFDVPKNEVAYNVQIVRLSAGGYATVYHGEPKKSPNKMGDSIKVAFEPGRFSFKMPSERRFAIHGDPLDTQSALYSTDEMMGGAGNPIVIKGKDQDPYYYVFFLAVTDDDGNWQGDDFRHSLCQARTLDFRDFDLRAMVGGRIEWKPFRADSPAEWKRAWVLRDTAGERICGHQPHGLPDTQGLIGSICFHYGAYYYFYTDRDTDGRFYLFYRTSPDLSSFKEDRTAWSAATRLSDSLPTGTVIRVAKARDRSRWAVLYNGYHEGPKGLRQDLFLQYTGDLSIEGTNGIAGVRWFDRFDRISGKQGISTAFLGLKSGGRIFAQHDFLTDPYGALAVPDSDDDKPQVGGLLTWADFSRGVYGGRVHWARWLAPSSSPTSDIKRSSTKDIRAANTTPANVPIELTFTARNEHVDPFNEVTLNVVFTEPDGTPRKVPAFWAGGQSWKARYASPRLGAHRWWSECSDSKDTGLHGVRGAVEVVPYREDNPLFKHGPIRIAADRRHFEHADGSPFFWLGDTWWMGLCHRLHWPDEFQRLAADRKAKGYNVVQLVAGLYPDMPPFDPRGANEAGFPWEKDYARIRPEYFDAADTRLRHLVDQGFTPCIVGAWGYFMPWMGEAKLKAHWRYLIARYGAWPVVWCAAGEANLPSFLAKDFPYDDQAQARRWCEVMRFIRTTDPWRRPLTIHPTAINAHTSRHVVDDEALLDFDFLQTPHGGPGSTAEAAAARTVVQSRAATPVMPVINGEASYEMLFDNLPTQKTRAMFWLCMMNGAAGHTYGANGIWQMNRKGQPHGPSPTATSKPAGYGVIPWDEAMNLPGSRQIGAAKAWLERLPWWEFHPHFTWVAWVDARADVAPCAIGSTDGPRVLYMLDPKPVVLRQLEPSRVYSLTHFDPVECRETDGGTFAADTKGEAHLSAPTHNHDWAVLIQPLIKQP